MKLKHRFNQGKLKSIYAFDNKCFICGKPGANSFHHIISPSSQNYKNIPCNKSVLNSCPIHNEKCHLYNPQLHQLETERKLLRKVISFLLKEGYQITKEDCEFYLTYKEVYNN